MMAPDPALALCVLRSWAPRAARPGPNVRACTPGRSQDTGSLAGNYVSERQGRATESKNAGPIWPARAIDNNECTGLCLMKQAKPLTDHYQVRGNLTFVGKWIDRVWTSGQLITQHNVFILLARPGLQNLDESVLSAHSLPIWIFQTGQYRQFCLCNMSLFLFVSDYFGH